MAATGSAGEARPFHREAPVGGGGNFWRTGSEAALAFMDLILDYEKRVAGVEKAPPPRRPAPGAGAGGGKRPTPPLPSPPPPPLSPPRPAVRASPAPRRDAR